jgi:hypothetical protein
LRYFFTFIGDYQSLLMLDDKHSTFCPSMDPVSIAGFIRFKRGVAGTVLLDAHGKPWKDVFGKVIKCQGGWKDPRNADQLMSAVTAVHEARNQRGPYFGTCEECMHMPADKQHHGCRFHKGSPLLWRKGNPKHSSLIANTLQINFASASDYVPSGDSPVTPWELMKVRNACISPNDLWGYQLWVMTIVGVKLFLRSDELIELTFMDEQKKNCINWDLTMVTETGEVTGIAFDIQGKCDAHPVTVMLWPDNDVPELCPVRHLMVYIYLTGISGGYFFPSGNVMSSIKDPGSGFNGHVGESISYATYQTRVKQIMTKLMKRKGPWGQKDRIPISSMGW